MNALTNLGALLLKMELKMMAQKLRKRISHLSECSWRIRGTWLIHWFSAWSGPLVSTPSTSLNSTWSMFQLETFTTLPCYLDSLTYWPVSLSTYLSNICQALPSFNSQVYSSLYAPQFYHSSSTFKIQAPLAKKPTHSVFSSRPLYWSLACVLQLPLSSQWSTLRTTSTFRHY